MKTFLFIFLLSSAIILPAQEIRYYGSGGNYILSSRGVSKDPEMSSDATTVLETNLWIGLESYVESSIPGSIEIDYSGEPFNKRFLGEVSTIKSLSLGTWVSYVEEVELGNPPDREPFRPIKDYNAYSPGYPSELGFVVMNIEDSNGYSKSFPLGSLYCSGDTMALFYYNSEYVYDFKRSSSQDKRSWFIKSIRIYGVRPFLMPEEIEIYWIGLTGDQ